ncbi:MAG TPA: SPOR domain-containing protein [Gemmatirosa sp.]|nr:SPOR domain-containing protein [Gemmatirosa sp.]
MRPSLLLAALGLVACGGDRRPSSAEPSAAAATSRGPDPVLLRVPRAGGRVTAAVYPRLDSVVWRSGETAPALARVLAFDGDRGVLAAEDTRGVPVRVDLRLGTVRAAGKQPLAALTAVGTTFYGVDADGAVTRLTTTGGGRAWKVSPGGVVEVLVPQRDGSLLAAGASAGRGRVWTLRPPRDRVADSASLPGGTRALRTGGVDRVYFAGGDALLAVRARGLEPVTPVALGAHIRAAVTTPSGDRLFVATERDGEVAVVDRYAERVAMRITLPGAVRDLRMDPRGRYLLARPERGDSAWVVALGTDRVQGVVRGTWRDDLPLVMPDGAIATVQGDDVAFVDAGTVAAVTRPRATHTVAGGAADLWHLVQWNGFRPRAKALDEPVTFEERAPAAEPVDAAPAPEPAPEAAPEPPPAADTAPAAPDDSGNAAVRPARPARPTVPPPSASAGRHATPRASLRVRFASAGEVVPFARPRPAGAAHDTAPPVQAAPTPAGSRAATRAVAPGRGFTVQYAATGTESEARRLLVRLRVGRPPARVVPTERDGKTMYRIVSGPYATRAAAEQAAEQSGADYWIYAGAP